MKSSNERAAHDKNASKRDPWHRRLMRTWLYGAPANRNRVAKGRVGVVILFASTFFIVIGARLVMFGFTVDPHGTRRVASNEATATSRPDIVDRNGQILATDIKAASLFAEPRRLIDKDEAVELLTATLPELDAADVRERLVTRRGFAWLKREITAQQQEDIHRLGLPGIGFLRENRRVYPNGAEVSHVIGLVNVDNQGIAGIEKWLDSNGLADLHRAGFANDRQQKPLELAMDLRVQHALRDELLKAQDKYKAKAAAGLVSDVRTGEIVAMVSVPDFDPNNPKEANDPTRINRLTTGVFEMGSTFKALTLAMALDSGRANLNTLYDARGSLRYGRFNIRDTHPLGRSITLSEVFTFSSNIGAARVALSMGVEAHKSFLRKMGQLDRLRTELPESAEPIVPRRWGELNTVTIAFGHGLSVAPLQAVMGINALMNGGYLVPPTFFKRSQDEASKLAKRVVSADTSEKMRYLMRANAERGTAKLADVKGYYVGGKTGTSEKVVNGRYSRKQVLNSFTAVLPSDNPRYQVLIMLDEPQGLPETHGFITSGWNAVPTGGKVIARIAPLLGIEPRFDLPPSERLILAASKEGR
jgi:cell division protein FtsI (penicillin-binding protein 3)